MDPLTAILLAIEESNRILEEINVKQRITFECLLYMIRRHEGYTRFFDDIENALGRDVETNETF